MPYHSGHAPLPYGKDVGAAGPSTSSGGRTSSANAEPIYSMEHLATFTVTKQTGIVYPADGMRRLLQLEKTNGIWSQKMQIRLERHWILIMDNETGVVMERFPAGLIQEPTAFTSRDPMEMYNNILVFTVLDETSSCQRAEMHIFQCQSVSAQDLVEDLKILQTGQLIPGDIPRGPRGDIPPPPALPPPDPPNGINVREQVSAFNAANNEEASGMSRDENNDEASSTSSEKYERDVAILNHCFDDIEKFIARLQHAAAAARELERRRRTSKSKKRNLGDGMLTMRSKPPPEMEFMDIFQKFKLSFNLLAKLKAHIHDPNAPELVHFLFTPLALIVDASHDTNYDTNLPSKVISPLLTRESVNLLMHCVTSKETELWHSLGDTWLVPREQWKGQVLQYYPVFTDGWSPELPIPEDQRDRRDHDHLTSMLNADRQKRDDLPEPQNDPYYGHHREVEESHYSSDYLEYDTREDQANEYFDRNFGTGSDLYPREERERLDQARAHSDISVDSIERGPRGGAPAIDRAQEAWLDDLLARHAKIVQVTYPRTANNDKELTVVRGEYLEILDDNRKWWKARNSRGQAAHVPHTIVTPHNSSSHTVDNDAFTNPLYASRYHRQAHGYNYEDSEVDGTSTSPAPEAPNRPTTLVPPAPADWVRKERLGKKENLSPTGRFNQDLPSTSGWRNPRTVRLARYAARSASLASRSRQRSKSPANFNPKKSEPVEPKRSLTPTPRRPLTSSPRRSPNSTPRRSPNSSPRRSPTLTPRRSPTLTPRRSPTLTPKKPVPPQPKMFPTLEDKISAILELKKPTGAVPKKSPRPQPKKSANADPKKSAPSNSKKSGPSSSKKSEPSSSKKSEPSSSKKSEPSSSKKSEPSSSKKSEPSSSKKSEPSSSKKSEPSSSKKSDKSNSKKSAESNSKKSVKPESKNTGLLYIFTPPRPPPPPPPPPPTASEVEPESGDTTPCCSMSSTIKGFKSMTLGTPTRQQEEMRDELKSVLNLFRDKKRAIDIVKLPEVFVDENSTPRQVKKWLESKGFSDKTRKQFKGMDGSELFNMTKRQLEHYCGLTDGRRLNGHLRLSRDRSEYFSSRNCELKEYLENARRKLNAIIPEDRTSEDRTPE